MFMIHHHECTSDSDEDSEGSDDSDAEYGGYVGLAHCSDDVIVDFRAHVCVLVLVTVLLAPSSPIRGAYMGGGFVPSMGRVGVQISLQQWVCTPAKLSALVSCFPLTLAMNMDIVSYPAGGAGGLLWQHPGGGGGVSNCTLQVQVMAQVRSFPAACPACSDVVRMGAVVRAACSTPHCHKPQALSIFNLLSVGRVF
jgi:hypothetical protein